MNNIRQQVLNRIAGKYSSTLQNFHQRELNQLIEEESSPYYFIFEDLMDLSEEQEFMKRYYKKEESKNKKILFGQYYSLHVDKPRVVNKDLENVYQKWYYKKRKLLFKSLYQQSKTVENSSESGSLANHKTEVSQFLYNISAYNPSSQNYYLNKQAKHKQKVKLKKQKRDREGRSVESMLYHLLDNSYGQKLTEISFTKKKKHVRYYSIDNLFNQRKSQNAIRITKKPVKILLSDRKSENILNTKNIRSTKILHIRNHKEIQQNPEKQRTSDRIIKNLSHTNFFSVQSPQKLPKKSIFVSDQLKPIDVQFSDKKFQQTIKMPRLIQSINKDEKAQKANKLLSIKLKC